MDSYNPRYNDYKNGKLKDIDLVLNEQNQIYGAHHWYPLLTDVTPESCLFELSDDDVKELSEGNVPRHFYFQKFVEYLICHGYQFVKTTHKSAHAFKPILKFEDFEDQMLNPAIIMSFRRYNCKFLLFRKWTEMNLECRVYVFQKQVKYVELYRDEKKEFNSSMFNDIVTFVNEKVVPKLSIYDDFTADVFYDKGNVWRVVEINSPLWLKCGTYLIKYEWEKNRIHESLVPICRYTDQETKEIIEV